MAKTLCTYEGNRNDAILAHLYEDGSEAARAAFQAHVAACAVCRAELAELAAVREQLGAWTPPEPSRAFTRRAPPPMSRLVGPWTRLAEMPAWGQVAAALLCLGLAAGLANLRVQYDRDGLSVRTGWLAPPAPPDSSARQADADAWRADLAALERQLRAEFQTATAALAQPAQTPAAQPANGEELLRRIRAQIEQSERRQQRELALRLGELLREFQAQRTADLVRIDRTLGYIQSGTGAEVMRQRRMLNDLAVRVTQRP
jgi:hypothetical protein